MVFLKKTFRLKPGETRIKEIASEPPRLKRQGILKKPFCHFEYTTATFVPLFFIKGYILRGGENGAVTRRYECSAFVLRRRAGRTASRITADVKFLTSAAFTPYPQLSFDINKLCQHLIRHRNNFGICLKATLGRDHFNKFIGKIHV